MSNKIELNDKTLAAVVEYINIKNEAHNKANKANFPVISVGNILEPKVLNDSIVVVLINGGIKGLQKHVILYPDLKFRKSGSGLGRPKKEV